MSRGFRQNQTTTSTLHWQNRTTASANIPLMTGTSSGNSRDMYHGFEQNQTTTPTSSHVSWQNCSTTVSANIPQMTGTSRMSHGFWQNQTTTSRISWPNCSTAVSAIASRVTHTVQVGAQGNLSFSPNQITAKAGDVINFQFLKLNHTLTQSSLEEPCLPNKQFDTGYHHFNPMNKTDNILQFFVQDTEPQWFFCHQNLPTSHCKAGMVFGLNPEHQMDIFLANALRWNKTAWPSNSTTGSPNLTTNGLFTFSGTFTPVPASGAASSSLWGRSIMLISFLSLVAPVVF